MRLDTIDGILEGLDELGYRVTLAELARVFDRHIPRHCLVETLADAPFSARDRNIIDLAVSEARTELRSETRRVRYGANPNVAQHFDVGFPPPTLREVPAANTPIFGSTEPARQRPSAARQAIDAICESNACCRAEFRRANRLGDHEDESDGF
jgi:hypothetical protein